jgi:hypothetical protein
MYILYVRRNVASRFDQSDPHINVNNTLNKFHGCETNKEYLMIKSRRLRWAGLVVRMAERCGYRVLVRKPEGRRPVERPNHRCEDNIKTDLRTVGRDARTGSN